MLRRPRCPARSRCPRRRRWRVGTARGNRSSPRRPRLRPSKVWFFVFAALVDFGYVLCMCLVCEGLFYGRRKADGGLVLGVKSSFFCFRPCFLCTEGFLRTCRASSCAQLRTRLFVVLVSCLQTSRLSAVHGIVCVCVSSPPSSARLARTDPPLSCSDIATRHPTSILSSYTCVDVRFVSCCFCTFFCVVSVLSLRRRVGRHPNRHLLLSSRMRPVSAIVDRRP